MFVDDIRKYVEKCLAEGKSSAKYVKITPIKARRGLVGEHIITRMADGYIESEFYIKNSDDYVVTNPNGEEFVVSNEAFQERYVPDPEKEGVYIPRSLPQEMLPLDEDVEFTAPWGKVMRIRAGGVLNITRKDEGYIYGIQPTEFAQTYKKFED